MAAMRPSPIVTIKLASCTLSDGGCDQRNSSTPLSPLPGNSRVSPVTPSASKLFLMSVRTSRASMGPRHEGVLRHHSQPRGTPSHLISPAIISTNGSMSPSFSTATAACRTSVSSGFTSLIVPGAQGTVNGQAGDPLRSQSIASTNRASSTASASTISLSLGNEPTSTSARNAERARTRSSFIWARSRLKSA